MRKFINASKILGVRLYEAIRYGYLVFKVFQAPTKLSNTLWDKIEGNGRSSKAFLCQPPLAISLIVGVISRSCCSARAYGIPVFVTLRLISLCQGDEYVTMTINNVTHKTILDRIVSRIIASRWILLSWFIEQMKSLKPLTESLWLGDCKIWK